MTRRIAHLVELSGGGPTTVALNYIQGQRAQGDEVHLIACRNLISEDLKTKIGTDLLYTSSRNPAQFPRVAKEVAALIDRVAPDVLHLHSAFAGVYGRMALSHLAVPRPAVVYCSHCWAFNQDVSASKKRVYAAVERHFLSQTDAIINISRYDSQAAQALGVNCGNDHLIYNGVADAAPGTQAADLGLDPSKINIGFFGRFDRQKGIDLLLEGFAQAARPELRLHLIGNTLRGDQDDLHLPAHVTRQDWVSQDQVDAHMRAFDLIALPSRWEGFSLVALEAMRNSRPLLVSDRCSLPEAVFDGVNGLVFELDRPGALSQALERLPDLDLARMGANARMIYETCFRFETHLAKVNQVYDDVLAKRADKR